MKILVDMNLAPRWTDFLRRYGIQALHWSEAGSISAPDEQIMAYAASHGFIVMTHDLDFSAILAATHGRKPSVVQIRAHDTTPEAIGPKIIRALLQLQGELESGALLAIDTERTRIRILPLTSDPQ